MIRKSSVIPIFWDSSGILNMVMSLFMCQAPGSWRAAANAKRPAGSLGFLCLRRLHFVSDRSLGGGDDLGGAPLGLDLLQCRFGEVVRLDDELLGHVSGAQDADAIGRALGEPGFL